MKDIIVLGAGMVGVATALALQKRGQSVTLLDRRAPGCETSYGNTGIIQTEAAEPYPMPRGVQDLARIALRRGNDVHWHLNALLGHLRPLWQYFHFSNPARHRKISRTYAQLIARAGADHAPLIAAANAEGLIRRDGFYQAYRDPRTLAASAKLADRLEREYEVTSVVLDSAALSRAEPNLLRSMAGAVHWFNAWTCSNPGGLVAAYANLFVSRGGNLVTGDAMTLAPAGSGWSVATLDTGSRIEATDVVIALGPWSATLCRRFGLDVPLFGKRGYHRHYQTGAGPNLAFVDADNGAVLAPMQAGLRITTGAEIARPDAAPDPVQLTHALQAARELFVIGDAVEPAAWMGTRPCMPDMLPLVGAIAQAKGLWANFGHGHQGFTLGPTTAELLAATMSGDPPTLTELAPVNRFSLAARNIHRPT